MVFFTGDGRGEPDARAAVNGTAQFVGVNGEAKLFSPEGTSGVLVLDLESLPPPPSAHHYRVWVLREEGGGVMESVGTFTPAGAEARIEFRRPGPGKYSAVDVSVELDVGPPEHSGVSLAAGRFGS